MTNTLLYLMIFMLYINLCAIYQLCYINRNTLLYLELIDKRTENIQKQLDLILMK